MAHSWVLSATWCKTLQKFTIHNLIARGPKGMHQYVHEDYEEDFNVVRDLSPKLRYELLMYMPNIYRYGDFQSYIEFWVKEWKTHGQQSGLSPQAYFEKVVQLYKLLPSRERMGLDFDVRKTVGDWQNSIKANCSTLPRIKVVGNTINEVEFYFDWRHTRYDNSLAPQNPKINVAVELKSKEADLMSKKRKIRGG
ncbi:hypothetical protein OROGR_023442 [Orobanche gracilis]